MQRYRLTKISVPDEAAFPTADTVEQYRENLHRTYGFSPPVEYYVEGVPFSYLAKSVMPEVGSAFTIARDNRNGVKCDGILHTSTVVAVNQQDENFTLFTTKNSIYKLEKISI